MKRMELGVAKRGLELGRSLREGVGRGSYVR